MKVVLSRYARGIAVAALVMTVAGCQREGVFVLVPPLASLRQVPVPAIVEPVRLTKKNFVLDAETNRYKPFPRLFDIPWINAERFTELCRSYFVGTNLFQSVETELPPDRPDMYLIFRPKVTVKQYVRPSIAGMVLSLGTGLIYNIIGGSDAYRYVDCELAIDVRSPSQRHIATYVSSCRSAERRVTDQPKQLGPLVSYAFTRSLEDVASRISIDNDLLMRALSADMTAKGVIPIDISPMRIQVRYPKGIVMRTSSTRISGQVTGVDRPVPRGLSARPRGTSGKGQ